MLAMTVFESGRLNVWDFFKKNGRIDLKIFVDLKNKKVDEHFRLNRFRFRRDAADGR